MVATKHVIDCLVNTNSKVMDYHGDISYTTGLGENLSETLRMEMAEKPGSTSDNILRWLRAADLNESGQLVLEMPHGISTHSFMHSNASSMRGQVFMRFDLYHIPSS